MSDEKARPDAPAQERVTPPPTMKSAEPSAHIDGDKPEEPAVVTMPSADVKAATGPKRSLPLPPPARGQLPSRPAAPKPTNIPADTKRTPTLTGASKPKEAKPKDELDIHSLFDVDNHPEEIDVEALFEDDAEAKRKAARASKPDQREISRSRKIVDEDLFNLSAGLFGSQPLTPLVAPDISALAMPGLSKETKETDKPNAQGAEGKAEPAKPVEPLFLVPTTKPPETPPQPTPTDLEINVDVPPAKPGLDRKRVGIGVVAVAAIAAAAFFVVQSASSKKDDATSGAETAQANQGEARSGTSPADNAAALGLETAKAPEPGANPSPSPAPTQAATEAQASAKTAGGGAEKRADTGAGARPGDAKPQGGDKPADKPPEQPTAAATPNKTQSLAEAMAAANAGGTTKSAPPPPPAAGGGGDFSTSAASSALGAAAGRAAGCKKEGDPSGTARVSVTFAPSGRATRATVNGPPFAGTPTGGCIAAAFRSASVPAFSGDPVTVSKSVTIR